MATPSSLRQLCEPCAAIFKATTLDLRTSARPHHRDIASFYSAVAVGCPMCKALLSEWDDDAPPSDDDTAPFHTVYTHSLQDLLYENHLTSNAPRSEERKLENALILNLVASNGRSRQFLLLPSSGTTSSTLCSLQLLHPHSSGLQIVHQLRPSQL